jgi:hypothetical protein
MIQNKINYNKINTIYKKKLPTSTTTPKPNDHDFLIFALFLANVALIMNLHKQLKYYI